MTGNTLTGRYAGTSNALFKLALKTSALTLITLGVYRFWGKTRIRKYIWSSTHVGEDNFEYTGTGLEKFLGFLIAVVVLPTPPFWFAMQIVLGTRLPLRGCVVAQYLVKQE